MRSRKKHLTSSHNSTITGKFKNETKINSSTLERAKPTKPIPTTEYTTISELAEEAANTESIEIEETQSTSLNPTSVSFRECKYLF
jgi:hypothetical protein